MSLPQLNGSLELIGNEGLRRRYSYDFRWMGMMKYLVTTPSYFYPRSTIVEPTEILLSCQRARELLTFSFCRMEKRSCNCILPFPDASGAAFIPCVNARVFRRDEVHTITTPLVLRELLMNRDITRFLHKHGFVIILSMTNILGYANLANGWYPLQLFVVFCNFTSDHHRCACCKREQPARDT